MICEAWYNIEDMANIKKINLNSLNDMETAIIHTNVDFVKNHIKDNTIYYGNILCNGFYKIKYGVHPPKCHNFVCFKTLVYYGLWKNCDYYSNLFILVKQLSKRNLKDDLNIYVNSICDLANRIDCCDIMCNLNMFYDHNTTNYKIVYDLLIENVNNLIIIAEKHYGEDVYDNRDDHDSRTTILNTTTDLEYCNITCHRKYINYDNINSISNTSELIGKIKYYWNKYVDSHEIMKILFSQQAVEYYRHTIINKAFQSSQVLDTILSNPYVDINYTHQDENILSLVSLNSSKKQEDYITTTEIINRIQKIGGNFPASYKIDKIISSCIFPVIREIIKNSDLNFLYDTPNNKNLLDIILESSNMMTTDKLELFEIILNRDFFISSPNLNDAKLIQYCIQDDRSIGLLEKIIEKQQYISKCSMSDIFLCIKLLKHKELDMLLTNRPEYATEKIHGYPPIVHYFKETMSDGIEEILLLKVLIKHKINPNIYDVNGDSPLILSVKMCRNLSFSLLFGYGADAFAYDITGYNSMHWAILKNNITVINMLKKFNWAEDNHIINSLTKNDKKCPLFLAMESDSKNILLLTQTLLTENSIDRTYKYDGNNILHHLININVGTKIKNILFKNYIEKDFDLLEECKYSMKPIVVKAVEKDLYEIVIMIMNKLLEKEEVKFDGFENLKDIRKIIKENKHVSIIVKNQNIPNFYSLVMMYLKNSKNFDDNIYMDNLFENLFVTLIVVLLLILFQYLKDQCIDKRDLDKLEIDKLEINKSE